MSIDRMFSSLFAMMFRVIKSFLHSYNALDRCQLLLGLPPQACLNHYRGVSTEQGCNASDTRAQHEKHGPGTIL